MAYIGTFRDGWRAQVQKDGQRVSKTFKTKREAQAWAHEVESKKTPLRSQSLSKAIKHYLETVSVHKKDATDWERRRFATLSEFLGDVPLSDISSQQIGNFRDSRLNNVSGSTVLREFNLYRNLFKLAQKEWKWISESPFDGVRLPKESPPRNQIWRWHEIKRVLRAERTGKTQEMQLAFHIALRTAMRLQEVLSAPENFDGKVVTVSTKTEALAKIPVGRIGAKLIPKKPFTVGPNEGSVLFSKLCRELLIKDKTFHDARATALTHLSKKVGILTLAKISRHKDLKQLQVYYRETAEEIAAKI